MRLIILFLFFELIILQVQAKTLQKTNLKDSIQFDYAWQDHEHKMQTLSFTLPKKLINNRYRRFKRYDKNKAMNYIYKTLLEQVSTYNPRKVRVQFKQQFSQLSYVIKSKNEKLLENVEQELTRLEQNSYFEFLEQHHYIQFYSPWGGTKVKPNHLKFVKEGVDYLQPITQAIRDSISVKKPRILINFVLSWIQSIPYSTLESRTESSGTGYYPPIKVIAQNIGDCDSKMTLMAAIIKKIYPRLSVSLIYLPKHALIGFQLPTLKSDKFTTIDGLHYILAEPVGPAKLPLSEIADSSTGYIDAKGFFYEVI
ncbi:hypothetical protein [Pseudoalteromonas denitrificans]|uniref:Transglutaminase-like superfamily protein n=1 Tax=Pseudoalteromonas denitrificans DSM 6059 TaxID=1123010 RepID=A0A1I1EBJ9_9GAMM|nr:hypothetical protein [Pseudoalteromonas denitrificans]SFB82758.1 hypothetical protein SAMN02745724_00248 [Pseudoalteromonas denitrificans DSM 6059]